jgi:tRNA dimethylallyltransferase
VWVTSLPPGYRVTDSLRTTVVAVVGPTAVGKSDLGVRLAQHLGGEVVNADSMQLYVGMDIGTAKPTAAERGGVPHHLLDVWPITQLAAAAGYQALARERIADIAGRGRLPVVVGGSGLYLRAALDRLEFPGESEPIRARLYAELSDLGPEVLHRRLAGLDPAAATAILPSNGRRIVRALEVIELTGQPFTATMPAFESIYRTVFVGLDRDDLDTRVQQRVEQMMAAGFLAEVASLLPLGLRTSPTAGRALGYAQLMTCLNDDGEVIGDLDAAIAFTSQTTRRFVRRQRSWFRRDPRITWLDAAAPDLMQQALAVITPTLEACAR